jgi:CubicO group peptidase (beta-lactamase class C family)
MTGGNPVQNALFPAVEARDLAGAAALVWRNGEIRHIATVGRRNLVSGAPVERDTIFRIASVTKPVTKVAALTLFDEGRFDLDEPITECAPELAHMRVLRDADGPLDQLTPEQRAKVRMLGQSVFAAGHGYGMGVAVVMEPEKADPLRCRGGVGTFGWPGANGGWWKADPNDGSVLIFLAHSMVELHQMARGIGLGVWSAIASFHRVATG